MRKTIRVNYGTHSSDNHFQHLYFNIFQKYNNSYIAREMTQDVYKAFLKIELCFLAEYDGKLTENYSS